MTETITLTVSDFADLVMIRSALASWAAENTNPANAKPVWNAANQIALYMGSTEQEMVAWNDYYRAGLHRELSDGHMKQEVPENE